MAFFTVGSMVSDLTEAPLKPCWTLLAMYMKSLTTGKGDSSQPLNLQQRVIQSGLDSLEGEDAANIVSLFKGKRRTLYGV